MIETYRVGVPEDHQEARPKRLKKFNLEGIPTVVITPHENLEVFIVNDNQDGITRVISIFVDNIHLETSILEHEMTKILRFGNQEDKSNPKTQHIYDKSCAQCINGKGHVIRVDDIALGEPNFERLRFLPWDSFLKKVGDANDETISRFEE